MDEMAARAELERMVAASSAPVLDEAALTSLVDQAKRPDAFGNPATNVASAPVWQASTVYVYGAVVTASPAAGRWWRCIQPGLSAATQPAWGMWGTPTGAPSGQTVTDGGVVWEDVGGPWAPTWDLNDAAARGWEMKAGLAAEDFDFTTDGQSFPRSQVVDHCEAMARRYRRRTVASAPVTSC